MVRFFFLSSFLDFDKLFGRKGSTSTNYLGSPLESDFDGSSVRNFHDGLKNSKPFYEKAFKKLQEQIPPKFLESSALGAEVKAQVDKLVSMLIIFFRHRW